MRATMTWMAAVAIGSLGCGGKHPPAKAAEEATGSDSTSSEDDGGSASLGQGDEKGDSGKPSPCTGFDMDLVAALEQSACEVQNPKPDEKPRDLKNVLDVKLMALGNSVVPGGHVDLVLTFTNKSTDLLPLSFTIDPLPRFPIEVYTVKGGRRVDLPAAPQPTIPSSMSREASPPGVARVTLAANGKATVRLAWDAKKMRWAPEKLKGTPPEEGYPRAPAGPLPKGKYMLRVVTPLLGVFEGIDHEMSAPRAPIEVSN